MNRALLSSHLPALALVAGYLAAAAPAAAQVAPPMTTGTGGEQPKASSTTFLDVMQASATRAILCYSCKAGRARSPHFAARGSQLE